MNLWRAGRGRSGIRRIYHARWARHADVNCTSLSVDALRELGLPIARRGASNAFLGLLGLPYFIFKEGSLAKGRLTSDYLRAEQTRLLPAAAFEEIFASAMTLAQRGARDGVLARMLAEDLEAIAYLRVPQFPSSRACGDAPVVSIAEYRARLPKDPALMQVIPLPPRPFPDALRD